MYNEVFYPCPECNGLGYMQIGQVVDGFGGFYLNDLSTLDELTENELRLLHSLVLDNMFECRKCGRAFEPFKSGANRTLAAKLFQPS